MGTFLSNDAYVMIGGVDLSDHCVSASLNYEAEALDDTVMGDGTRSNFPGLKNWGMNFEFFQDYATGSVDPTLFPLIGTTTTCTVRAVSTGGVSATSPNFTGLGLVQSYNPVAGSVGEMAKVSVTIAPAGTLSRATS